MERDTTGHSDVVYNLSNVGNITMPYTSNIKTSTGSLYIGTMDNESMGFMINGEYRWLMHNSLFSYSFFPTVTNAYDIGTTTYKIRDGYFAGTLESRISNVRGLATTDTLLVVSNDKNATKDSTAYINKLGEIYAMNIDTINTPIFTTDIASGVGSRVLVVPAGYWVEAIKIIDAGTTEIGRASCRERV